MEHVIIEKQTRSWSTVFRKSLFWMHLAAGVAAGLIILIMSVTGVALTYQKQMTKLADRIVCGIDDAPGKTRLPLEELLPALMDGHPPVKIERVTLYADGTMPVKLDLATDETLMADPYDGRRLGAGATGIRNFFELMIDWHRWLAMSGGFFNTGRAITGACNLAFLFVLLTGICLWWPKNFSAKVLRPAIWFRRRLSGPARDWHWHNVIGFWMFIPLAVIVAGGVVISYNWAGRLLYTLTGSEAPVRGLPRPQTSTPAEPAILLEGLDRLIRIVENRVPDWKTMSFRPPNSTSQTVLFQVDTGTGGQPQHWSALTLDRSTGAIAAFERFGGGNPGMSLRMWFRFAHTGEYYGFAGQTIAGLASLAAVLLTWTGISLSFRRYRSWRAKPE